MTYTHDFRVVSYLDEVKLETEVSDALNMGYEIQNAKVIQIAEGILHTVYLTKKEKNTTTNSILEVSIWS